MVAPDSAAESSAPLLSARARRVAHRPSAVSSAWLDRVDAIAGVDAVVIGRLRGERGHAAAEPTGAAEQQPASEPADRQERGGRRRDHRPAPAARAAPPGGRRRAAPRRVRVRWARRRAARALRAGGRGRPRAARHRGAGREPGLCSRNRGINGGRQQTPSGSVARVRTTGHAPDCADYRRSIVIIAPSKVTLPPFTNTDS